jgi:exodeoxyribonuclease VII large subunit
VRLLDPVHVLARGWSITRNARGEVVRSVADTAPGERIVTLLADGAVTSTVDSTEGKA